jgi:thiamine pyrophosphokinase
MEQKEDRLLILSGGNLNIDFLNRYLEQHKFNQIICVDGALAIVDQLNIDIDYLVGDFDTISSDILDKYLKKIKDGEISTILKKYQPEKDYTDTDIAIELAVQQNPSEIVLLGATGTRLDHMMSNINSLIKPLSQNIKAFIIDEHNKIYLIHETTTLKKNQLYGPFVSLIAFSDKVSNVTLKGMKYPLVNYELTKSESIGISNEMKEEEAVIELEKGIIIVVEAKD